MRIVPFPGHDDESIEHAWLTELESALSGDANGSAADSWRELREDVRALAPPIAPDFEQRFRERIGARSAKRWVPRLRLRPSARPVIAAVACVLCAALVALVVVAPWRGARPVSEPLPSESASSSAATVVPSLGERRAKSDEQAAPSASAGASSSSSKSSAGESSSNGPASAPGRVQQLGASVTLAVAPTDVQQTADRVSRLVVRDGGYVQSSRVQVQGSAGEANLMLKLPSGKLSAALASIEQIAPVREESQSLQDITNTYNAARQRLSDAEAERQALLHALSKAISEGEIDSLHERLSQSRSAIAHAHAALEAVSRQASTAEVEVSVLGNAHAASEGLTLHRGLHDAGRVLTVTLVVVLIAAAVLIPLALILLALMLAGRAWRRHRREQALAPQ
jgi:hypothetical protein